MFLKPKVIVLNKIWFYKRKSKSTFDGFGLMVTIDYLYLTNLVSCNYFLFPKLKTPIKWIRNKDIFEVLNKASKQKLKS